ncbi:MAG TPA: 50S ribosomal protein L15 [Acidimicrobiia bacterium]|jgi:large subunit ribosomal protein L15|nr:50S ribosomal protein L15 [Acidimicrobiia bacterium]
MKVHDLKPAPGSKPKKQRVARGIGGRRGKTAGTGTKGQGTRGKIPPKFEGGQTPLSRRTPKLKGFKNPFRIEYTVINLDHLDGFDAGSEVTPETLRARGLVHKHGLVKVLGRGEITKALTIRVHAISASAAEKIKAAGGTVEVVEPPGGTKRPPARGNALTNR